MRPILSPMSVPAARRAFTLIEMVVVVAVLALLAAMVMPRLTSTAPRRAAMAADQVADLLSLFAHRTMVGNDQLAVAYDPDAGAIMLIELLGDPTDPNNPVRWDFDPYSTLVRLPDDMVVSAARRDGRLIALDEAWYIPILPGEGRPNIEIDLYHIDLDLRFSVYLASFEVAAKVLRGNRDEHLHRLPVDLDAVGRGEEVW